MKNLKHILILAIITTLIYCSKKNETSISKEKTEIDLIAETENLETKTQNLNIDSLWQIAIDENDCLAGGQYVRSNGKFLDKGIFEKSNTWKTLINQPKKKLTPFLISKMESRDSTAVHTCPFHLAKEGELAVYTLQRIHKKNWFDFEDFSEYKDRETTSSDNAQTRLQNILKNPKDRKVLERLWMNEMEK